MNLIFLAENNLFTCSYCLFTIEGELTANNEFYGSFTESYLPLEWVAKENPQRFYCKFCKDRLH